MRHDSAQKIIHMLNGCLANIADDARIQYGDVVHASVCLNTASGLNGTWVVVVNLEQSFLHSVGGVLLLHEHLVLLALPHCTDIARIDDKESQTKRGASCLHFALHGMLAKGIVTTASGPVGENMPSGFACVGCTCKKQQNQKDSLRPRLLEHFIRRRVCVCVCACVCVGVCVFY